MTCINCNVNILEYAFFEEGVHYTVEYRDRIFRFFRVWGPGQFGMVKVLRWFGVIVHDTMQQYRTVLSREEKAKARGVQVRR